MELGCLLPPTAQTPADIVTAEALGYERALVYDSPTFLADPWITLALAAARTSRIRLGVAVITPRLRHVAATATALATLHAHAQGRVEAVIGSGFTARLMLGKKPVPWAEVEQYAVALRALLTGDEIEWDDALIGLKHGPRTGIKPPGPGIPLYVAAHGPRGYGVAERTGDGIVTNMSHRGKNPPPPDMSRVQVLYYGTVLSPGEGYGDERVLSAAGPYAAFQLHLGDLGVADVAETAAFGKALAGVDENRRHLEVHQAHLIDLTELDRPHVTGDLIARTTATGPPGQVRARLADIAAEGARGVLYGPMGDDVARELRAFAEAAATVCCAKTRA
jgi:5,10-methylenetetrahydromethanopterin reductase